MYRVVINVHSFIDIVAFQLQLKHNLLTTEVSSVNENTVLLFPYEFVDADNNLFPSQSELVEDGEKYIMDASIYTLESVSSNDLNLN